MMDYLRLIERLEKQRDDAIDGWRRALDITHETQELLRKLLQRCDEVLPK